jgi:hypothetical protein
MESNKKDIPYSLFYHRGIPGYYKGIVKRMICRLSFESIVRKCEIETEYLHHAERTGKVGVTLNLKC